MKRSTNAKHVGAALVGFGFVALGVAPGCGSSSNGGTPGGGAPDAAGDHTTGGSEAGADAPGRDRRPGKQRRRRDRHGRRDGRPPRQRASRRRRAPPPSSARRTPRPMRGRRRSRSARARIQWGTYTYESDGPGGADAVDLGRGPAGGREPRGPRCDGLRLRGCGRRLRLLGLPRRLGVRWRAVYDHRQPGWLSARVRHQHRRRHPAFQRRKPRPVRADDLLHGPRTTRSPPRGPSPFRSRR